MVKKASQRLPLSPLQAVKTQELQAALAKADLCVADSKARVEAFKCFKFADGLVSSFDGQQGIVCKSPIQGDFMVQAEKFRIYVNAMQQEELHLDIQAKHVGINGRATFATVDADFPDLISVNAQIMKAPENATWGLRDAIKAVLFCAEKAAEKRNIPHGILLKDRYAYAADGLRVARCDIGAEITRPVYLPVPAAKIIAKLGNPETLYADDSQIGAFFPDWTYFMARQLTGTDWSGAVERKIAELDKAAKWCALPEIPHGRLAKLSGDGLIKILSASDGYINCYVQDRGSGITVEEPVPCEHWQDVKTFTANAELLSEALSQGYELWDVGSLPAMLRFSNTTTTHLLALHGA